VDPTTGSRPASAAVLCGACVLTRSSLAVRGERGADGVETLEEGPAHGEPDPERWARFVTPPARREPRTAHRGPFGPGRESSARATIVGMNAPWWRIKTELQSTDKTLSTSTDTDDDLRSPFVD